MAVTIEAVFDGEAFHPTEPLPLAPDRRYLLTIDEPQDEGNSGTGDAWDVLEALAGSVEAPPDWALEHDHYLLGGPKRGEGAEPRSSTPDATND